MSWSWHFARQVKQRPGPLAARSNGWMVHRRRRKEALQLPVEAEAFLEGHYAEYCALRAEAVPVWAWTNLLAHGGERELQAESRAPSSRPTLAELPWRQARSSLAAEVLECAEQHCPLPSLQQEVLIPLELALAADRCVPKWSPSRWASAVHTALVKQARSAD